MPASWWRALARQLRAVLVPGQAMRCSRRPSRKLHRSGYRPRLQALEGRVLPSVAWNWTDQSLAQPQSDPSYQVPAGLTGLNTAEEGA